MQNTIAVLDRAIARLLFVRPQERREDVEESTVAKTANRAFGFSLVFSGVRCILQYAVLPFILPIIGIAGDFAIHISLVISVAAILSLIFSVRRFWAIDYSYKWQYLFVAGPAMIILVAFLYLDLQAIA